MNTRVSERSHQSGQIIVLLAMASIALFGFAALAIDGGAVYAERRRLQNTADAAALAAALAKINGQDLSAAAFDRMASNGYPTSPGACDPAGADCVLGGGSSWQAVVSNPPRGGEYAGRASHIRVEMTSDVQTSFAQLVLNGPLTTTVEAVAETLPRQNISPGNAIHAASEHGCKALWFAGTSDTTVDGGDVFSNSDAYPTDCQSGRQDGSARVIVGPAPHSVRVVGTFGGGGSGGVSPPPIEGVPTQDLPPVPVPDCSSLADFGPISIGSHATTTLQPGKYQSVSFGSGATITMNAGMYCIYGLDGFKGSGGTLTGAGIMIYLQQGDFDLGGNSTVHLGAEQSSGVLVDPSHSDWKGMLIYADPYYNSQPIIITGTSDSTYLGTIFAISSECSLRGTGDGLGLNSQVICDTVKMSGTAAIDINYNAGENFDMPPALSLTK